MGHYWETPGAAGFEETERRTLTTLEMERRRRRSRELVEQMKREQAEHGEE